MVLFPADQFLNPGIQGLDTDFKLQAVFREPADHGFQFFREVIGYQFEMQVQILIQSLQEELHDTHAGFDLQVEGAIHELEMTDTTVI